MFKAKAYKYTLDFKRPSGTSRGVLKQKESWFIKTWFEDEPDIFGIGECGLLKGLSYDDVPNYEQKVIEVCENINQFSNNFHTSLKDFPSIRFGLEMSLMDIRSLGKRLFYKSDFTEQKKGIPINGLVWMGSEEFMLSQIEEKLDNGFDCIKMKIGAIDFETEYKILQSLRKRYSKETIEIRVDANGAFSLQEVNNRLEQLSKLDIHSIEQPIKQGQIEEMYQLCRKTPLPIALDEELIGIFSVTKKQELLQTINPQYIILKPSLVGGFRGSEEWISIAEKQKIKWWITSALESNVGLNAIAQWTFTLQNKMPQGLGTGSLFTNNFESPLQVKNGTLRYDNTRDLSSLYKSLV